MASLLVINLQSFLETKKTYAAQIGALWQEEEQSSRLGEVWAISSCQAKANPWIGFLLTVLLQFR
jgi:hypothetical protein